jgi:putative ABC transport system permease protein
MRLQLLIDILGQIFRTLWAHKLRSFLTMFGIAWGVGSLLLLVGVGEGFRSGNKRGFDELGKDTMFVFPGRAPAVKGSQQSGRYYPLVYSDYVDLTKAPHIRDASPVLQRDDIRSVSDYSNGNGSVMGVEPQFRGIRYLPIQQGRWLNEMDESERRNVAVIGTEIVRTLYPGRPPIGNTLLLNGIRFEIVGILDTIGRGDNIAENSRIYVPFSVMNTYFPKNFPNARDALSYINYQPRVREEHEIAHQEMRAIIGRNHGLDVKDEDSFEEFDSVQSAEMVGKIFDAMDLFLGFVGLVTLALGGIGVINIMLISVTERTREIGLRKALGATNRSILLQFFLEGSMLTVVSGIVGVLGATAITVLLSGVQLGKGFDPPKIVWSSAVVAVGSLAIAGVVAGLYPARRAAKLAPVEALRQE